jgi:small-conductance mechanosensitive channel
MKKHQYINPFTDMDRFITSLQKEDVRYSRFSRNVQWIMWVFAPLYAGMFLLNPDMDTLWTQRIGGLCYVIAFVMFALILQKFNNEFKSVDYGVSVVEMLTSVAKRYRLLQLKLVVIIAPILLIDAGMVLILWNRFGTKNAIEVILWVQMILIPSLLVGISIGIIIWRKRQKPLRDAALAMLKELIS